MIIIDKKSPSTFNTRKEAPFYAQADPNSIIINKLSVIT